MTTEQLAILLPWSAPRKVQTKQGPRLLRTAPPTLAFWDEWKLSKAELRQRGISLTKNEHDQWEVCWWQHDAYSPQRPVGMKGLTHEQYGRLKEVEPKLLPWQAKNVEEVVSALNSDYGALDASDTGTGKTYVMCAVSYVMGIPLFVVTPRAVIPAWQEAAAHIGNELRGVINYDKLRGGKQPELKRLPNEKRGKKSLPKYEWSLPKNTILIFDECHRLCDYRTQNCAMGMASLRQAHRVIGLSATAADDPRQMQFVAVLTQLIKTEAQFWGWMMRNGVTNETFGLEFNDDNNKIMNRLHHQIFPNHGTRASIEQIKKEYPGVFPETVISAECYDLGAKAEAEINNIYSEMNSELAEIDKAVAADKKKAADRLRKKGHVLTDEEAQVNRLTVRLRAAQKIELLKVPAMAALARDAEAEGMSVAIFVNFDPVLKALVEKLKTRASIHGGQVGRAGDRNRARSIDHFQADLEHYIVCNTRAGGVGVSLHGSPTARPRFSIISPTDSAKDLKQVLGRVHRARGATSIQKIFYAAGTVEEKTCRNVRVKLRRLDVLNDGDTNLGSTSVTMESAAVPEGTGSNSLGFRPDELSSSGAYERPAINAEFLTNSSPKGLKELPDRPSSGHQGALDTIEYSADQVRAMLEALRLLALQDTDRARERNGAGFSKFDNDIGHSLAQQAYLSPRQARVAYKLCMRYSRTQLPEELVGRIRGKGDK